MADYSTTTLPSGLVSDPVAKYFQAKMDFDPRTITGNATETPQQVLLRNMNVILNQKGGNQISDLSQADSAFAPLIAKRNKRGLGGILGMALPIAAGFLAGPLGGALAGGLGISTTAGTALAGAGLGGLSSALTGQNVLKGAAMGGLSGGLQGATAGKVLATSGPLKGQLVTPGVSSTLATSGPLAGSVITPNIGSGIGSSISNFAPDLIQRAAGLVSNTTNKINNIGGQVASAIGLPSQTSSAMTNVLGTAAPTTGGITMGNPLSTALSGFMEYKTQNDIAEKLKKSQLAALQQIQPYTQTGAAANQQLADALAAGFNPGDLSSDPGYQFRYNQGQKSLGQSLAARGLGQSGAALKAAQEYGQNFANNEYTDAYNRWLANNQQLNSVAGRGYNAASEAGDYLSNIGAVGAQGIAGRNNAVSSALSGLLSGRGIIGFDSMGNPIYG